MRGSPFGCGGPTATVSARWCLSHGLHNYFLPCFPGFPRLPAAVGVWPFLHHQTWRQSHFPMSHWLCLPPHMASEDDIPTNPLQGSRDACAHPGNPGSPMSSFTVPYTKSCAPRGDSDCHNFISPALVNSFLPLLPSEGKAPTLPFDVWLPQSPTSRKL